MQLLGRAKFWTEAETPKEKVKGGAIFAGTRECEGGGEGGAVFAGTREWEAW
jgi:hypothetical protein